MIYSTQVETSLGTFQIFCNSNGLTTIQLPGKNKPLKDTSFDESGPAPSFLQTAAQQIVEYSKGERTIFDLPLAPHGTPFQRQVWDIISTIPYGRTMSYGEIAKKLGSIHKARAVGGAANANQLPLVIPCHRVVGTDGSLTGFAGGIELKDTLLQLENNPEK